MRQQRQPWLGSAGSNGAQVEFTADGQDINGDIIVDSIYKSMQAWSMRGVVGSNWVLSFVFALICATAGLVLIVCSGFGSRTIVVLLGINLMVNGVMGIVGNVAGQKN